MSDEVSAWISVGVFAVLILGFLLHDAGVDRGIPALRLAGNVVLSSIVCGVALVGVALLSGWAG
jgi:hypothetical protein